MSIKRTLQILTEQGLDRSTAQNHLSEFLETGRSTISIDLLEDAITAAGVAQRGSSSRTAAQQFYGARQTLIKMRVKALKQQKRAEA